MNTMSNRKYLTTNDNVFDPYTQFSDWLAEDIRLGHYTCGLIGRVATQLGFADDDDDEDRWQEVLDFILRYDLAGIYKIVEAKDEDNFDSRCKRF